MTTDIYAKYEDLAIGFDTTDHDRVVALVDAIEQHNDETSVEFKRFSKSIVQGEKLALARLLDEPWDKIAEDQTLSMIAMGYIREKREHGRANLKLILDLTDDELVTRHGFMAVPDEETAVVEEMTRRAQAKALEAKRQAAADAADAADLE